MANARIKLIVMRVMSENSRLRAIMLNKSTIIAAESIFLPIPSRCSFDFNSMG